MAATTPARRLGVARAVIIRKDPRKTRPKPAPAAAAPAMKAADLVVAIAPNASAMPANRNRQPASITARELIARRANTATAAAPKSKKITSPPHSGSGEPAAWAASDGPSDR